MLNRELQIEFASIMSHLSGKDYVTSRIAFGAAPTLLGSKPSTILTFKHQQKNTFTIWNRYKKEICHELGLEFYELIERPESITVLFYRKDSLENYLKEDKNQSYLEKLGYKKGFSFDDKLKQLKKRYATTCPHEMGIFLGIPVEDVCGFIMHQGKNCLLCRYWKVYHDLHNAQKQFESFDCARRLVIRQVIEKYRAA